MACVLNRAVLGCQSMQTFLVALICISFPGRYERHEYIWHTCLSGITKIINKKPLDRHLYFP